MKRHIGCLSFAALALLAVGADAQDQPPQPKLWERSFSGGAMRHYEVTALGTLNRPGIIGDCLT